MRCTVRRRRSAPRRAPCSRRTRRRSPCRGDGAVQAGAEAFGRGEPAGVQFGIAAGQVDGIGRAAAARRRAAKRRTFGALAAPAVEHGGVGEEERLVARDGDARAERRQRERRRRGASGAGRPARGGGRCRNARPRCRHTRGLTLRSPRRARRPARGRDGAPAAPARVLRYGAEAGQRGQVAARAAASRSRWRAPATRLRIIPASGTRGIVPREAGDQRCDRGALPAGIDDEHDGPPGQPGQRGCRAGLAVGAAAVEQAHDPFGQHDLGALSSWCRQAGQGGRPHRPSIEVEAFRRWPPRERSDQYNPGRPWPPPRATRGRANSAATPPSPGSCRCRTRGRRGSVRSRDHAPSTRPLLSRARGTALLAGTRHASVAQPTGETLMSRAGLRALWAPVLAIALAIWVAAPAQAGPTLDKVKQAGALTCGVPTGVPGLRAARRPGHLHRL